MWDIVCSIDLRTTHWKKQIDSDSICKSNRTLYQDIDHSRNRAMTPKHKIDHKASTQSCRRNKSFQVAKHWSMNEEDDREGRGS